MRLSRHSYSTLRSIQGPLVFVENVIESRMGEVVTIVFPDGHETPILLLLTNALR